MEQDRAVPAPILIAPAWRPDCSDAGTLAAQEPIGAAETAADEAAAALALLALPDSTARDEADAAVVAAQVLHAAAFATDDAARVAWQEATVAQAAAAAVFDAQQAVDGAAALAKGTADGDLLAADALKLTLDAAKAAADAHHAEQSNLLLHVNCELNAKNAQGTRVECTAAAYDSGSGESRAALTVADSAGLTMVLETAIAARDDAPAGKTAAEALAEQRGVTIPNLRWTDQVAEQRAGIAAYLKAAAGQADSTASTAVTDDAVTAGASTTAAVLTGASTKTEVLALDDAAMAAHKAYKANSGGAASDLDMSAVGAYVTAARTLTAATKTWWTNKAAEAGALAAAQWTES